MFLAGPGMVPTHNTRTAAETVRGWVESGERRHIALIGANAADVRDTMVEPVYKQGSGIMQICPPWNMPHYSPTKKTIVWTNPNYKSYGAVCSLYSGEEPDGLRGPSHDAAWIDEWAKMKYGETVMQMLKFTLRRGENPKTVISTTPKRVQFLIDMLKMAEESKADGTNDIIVVRGNTYENRANLASEFILDINQQYEGTTLGRQEIYADLVIDADGALWTLGLIDMFRIKDPALVPSMRKIVIAIDPQTGYKVDKEIPVSKLRVVARSTMTGIVAVGLGITPKGMLPHAYVLDDASINGKPEEWGAQAVRLYHRYSRVTPTILIAEGNQGGEMIRSVIQSVDRNVPVQLVTAKVKKHERAIPVVAKYQKGQVHHLGVLADLETEQCLYEPGDEDSKMSPNRMDALVWAVRHILVDGLRAGAGIALSRRV
jgi:phage terminase large subunit-like protein